MSVDIEMKIKVLGPARGNIMDEDMGDEKLGDLLLVQKFTDEEVRLNGLTYTQRELIVKAMEDEDSNYVLSGRLLYWKM